MAVSRSLAIGTEDVLELSSTRPEASVTEFFLRVALRFRLLGSAAGIHLKAVGAHFDHRRRTPTEVTVRRVDDKSWQLEWCGVHMHMRDGGVGRTSRLHSHDQEAN